jgi:hypothetical protein
MKRMLAVLVVQIALMGSAGAHRVTGVTIDGGLRRF